MTQIQQRDNCRLVVVLLRNLSRDNSETDAKINWRTRINHRGGRQQIPPSEVQQRMFGGGTVSYRSHIYR